MKCRNCNDEIHVCDVATVSEDTIAPSELNLDIQIRCPKCETNHFTFIPVADLTDDIS